ncbi:MAG: metallophosphoesterase [Candidatus Thorarchaeota archaeon]
MLKCCILDIEPPMESIFEDRGMTIKWSDRTVLLISDIHLGFEVSVSQEKGVEFPPQYPVILKRIESLIKKHSASHLYIIGDVKHSIFTDDYSNWEIIPEFMEGLTKIVETTIIPGNHDGVLEPLLPRTVTLTDVHGIALGSKEESVGLFHGHTWPSHEVLDTKMIVVGHNHPTVRRLRDASVPEIGRSSRKRLGRIIPVIVQSKLDKNCARRNMGILENLDDTVCTVVTLPSFNELFAGMPINQPSSNFHGPLFENMCVNLPESEVYSIDGLFLGSIDWLRNRSNEMIKSKAKGTDFEKGR